MKKKITIEGMSCGHCVGSVDKALRGISGVHSVEVDLKEKNAVVDLAHDVDSDQLKAAIDEAGFQAIDVVEI